MSDSHIELPRRAQAAAAICDCTRLSAQRAEAVAALLSPKEIGAVLMAGRTGGGWPWTLLRGFAAALEVRLAAERRAGVIRSVAELLECEERETGEPLWLVRDPNGIWQTVQAASAESAQEHIRRLHRLSAATSVRVRRWPRA